MTERRMSRLSRVTELCAVMDRIVNLDQGTASASKYGSKKGPRHHPRFVKDKSTKKKVFLRSFWLAQLVEHSITKPQARVRFPVTADNETYSSEYMSAHAY